MAFKFDVVISGISGRFPECDDIDTFKRKLYSGNSNEFVNCSERKWTRGFKLRRYGDKRAVPEAYGKYLKELDIDYRLFKFNQLFARSTDVVNRKLLEASFEAIVDAGINPYSLDGANIGVFTSGGISEREIYCVENMKNHVFVLGSARTMAPNRLSYALNFIGPSFAYHTDPLGGLEALKTAKDLISDGSIEAAVVSVSSNLADPKYNYLYMTLDLVSPDEFCRSFDKNANGFVRSEGTVAFFLQREQDAKRHYAKLLLCDNIFDGLSSHTLLGYDEEYVKNSLTQIYERNMNSLYPEDIGFVELTGCATKKFELSEANAVADILCKRRTTPLMTGSVKSNVGHVEVASAHLSILKTLLILDSRIIPPNSNLLEVNDDIRAFREKQLQVVDKKTELSGNIAAVNIIGLCGTVNHVVLQNNTRKQKPTFDNIPRLLLLSGRTADGMRQVFKKVEFDHFNPEAIALANEAFQKNMPFHVYRGFTILPKTEKTTAVLDEGGHPHRPICFIFSGMGSQWNGMGKQLLDFPVIAEVIKRCDAVLKQKSIDIYKVLLSDDPTIFDDITMSFVAIICMQIALVEVLKKLNIVPDLILGHSVGENGCAYVDGCLTLEQAVLVSYNRGIASTSTKTIKGMMAAIGKGYNEIKNDIPENIEIACHNAVNSCTLSGPAQDIDAFVETLKNQGVFAKSVNVANIAYHSKYIAPAAPKLLELLREVIPEPKKRSSKWISSSVPESEWHLPIADLCSAEYLTNNLLKPVLFEEACKHIPKDAVCIEIAPHGLLQAILKRSLPATCTNISLTLRSTEKNNLNFLLTSIGKLFVAGCEPAVNNLYPPIEYPVSRGTPSISSYCTWFYGDMDAIAPPYKPAQPLPLSIENIAVRINKDAKFSFLQYHQINENTIIPPTFFIYLVWRMLAVQQKVNMDSFPVLFEKIKVHENVTISISKPRLVNILIQGSGCFEVLSRARNIKKEKKVILTGRVEFLQDKDLGIPPVHFNPVESEFLLNADEIQTILKNAGFLLGECFQLLNAVKLGDSESQGNIEWRGNWVTFLDSIMKFQMFSDLKKSKLCFLKTIRRMTFIPSVLNSQKSGSLVSAKYCKVTKCFQCHGVEVYDAMWKTNDRLMPSKLPSSLKIRQMRFVSYTNPMCQSLDEFVDLCVQISLESMELTNKMDSKFYICDYTGKFIKNIRRSETIYDLGKGKVIFCDIKTPKFESLSQDAYLFIAAEKMPDINVSHSEALYILLIMSEYDSTIIPKKFAVILRQSFGNKTFILLKKKLDYVPTTRVEKKNTLSCGLSNSTNHAESETVIRPNFDETSLTLMFSKTKHLSTRYVFMNGDEQCVESEPTFKSRLAIGLPKVVMKNRDWGSYRYQLSDLVNGCNDNTILRNSLIDIKIQSICVQFIRPDLATPSCQSDEDLATLEKSIGIEFSGVNATGQKLMGLTMVNLCESFSKLDPLLTWKVPEKWTLAEAATVPFIYAHVFHIPKIITRSVYMPSPIVLISAGEDMLIVEVCISMCISRGYQVYVVVSSAEQVHRLRRNCPWLHESCIILNNSGTFDSDLLLKTKGQGVNVVINYSTGGKNLTAALNCISSFAFYIETEQSNMNDINEFGMRPFAYNLTFIAFPRSISYLHNLLEENKKILHEAVNQGIEAGLVRPVEELTLKEPSIQIDSDKDVSNERKSTTPVIKGGGKFSEKFGFRHRHSHVIFGGECSEESWINLIYWLKGKGATNFVVLVEKFPTKQRMSQLLNRLLADKKIIVSFKPLKQLTSVKDASQFMQETSKIAPIDSVFFVSLDSSSQKIHFMDMASRQYENSIKFFSLFSGGLKEMELRRSKGLPAFVLHGESFPKNVVEVMEEFEKNISNYNLNNSQDILFQIIEKQQLSISEDMLSSLRNHLPKTIDCLEDIGRHLSGTVEFVEATSKGVELSQSRGVLPIFVVPGLHASQIQCLLHSLMYPVFCASLSENCSSVSETATKLFQHLKKIQPRGPVTLIGETWNGAVAVELSLMIKQCGRDFRLFLLQGNPVEWKEIIRSLNLIHYHDFENTLIQIYGEKLKKCLSSKPLSADRNGSGQMNPAALVRRCLDVLKCQFNNVYDYNVDTANLENTVLFSETVRQNIASAVSNTCDIICIKENKFENFIRSPVIRKTINKQAMFSWNV